MTVHFMPAIHTVRVPRVWANQPPEWWWPLYAMPAAETLDEAIAQFDALDVEPWASAPRRVTRVEITDSLVWESS